MIKFSKNGNNFNIVNMDEDTTFDKLPANVYILNKSMFGYYLSIYATKFEVPSQVFGKINQRVDKIIRTYESRNVSTGILFTGTKGSGKTMLSNSVCNKMIEKGIPVILINEPYIGDDFVEFIDMIGECVLFFDEFGKKYKKEEGSQDGLLSMLDGFALQKRLILMTENNVNDINTYLISRPGRIYYHFKYDKLDQDTISDYCQFNDIDVDAIKQIVDISRTSKVFSFDILKAIVEEYKRYGGDVKELLEDLNVGIASDSIIRLEVIKIINKNTKEEFSTSLLNRYINKPIRGEWIGLRVKYNPKEIKLIKKEMGEDFDIEEHGTFMLNFVESHLRYDSEKTLVYDNGEYIITCNYSGIETKDYSVFA